MHGLCLRLIVVLACLLTGGQPALVLACEMACADSPAGEPTRHRHRGQPGVQGASAHAAPATSDAIPDAPRAPGHCSGQAAPSHTSANASTSETSTRAALRPVTPACTHETGLGPARMSERNRLAPPATAAAAALWAVVAPSFVSLSAHHAGAPVGLAPTSALYPIRI